MRALAVANAKGGSAKTTTAVSLAAAWAGSGYRVLLIDADPQASATSWIGMDPDDGRDLAEALMDETERPTAVSHGRVAALAHQSRVAGVDLIGSGRWVGRAERVLIAAPSGRTALAGLVTKLPAERWHVGIIDCPPAVGLMTVNALAAARDLVIPVEAHGMALSGVKALMEVVAQVRDGGLNPAIAELTLVVCRTTRTLLSRNVVDALRERYGDLVAQTAIRDSIRVAEAPTHHLPVTTYDPQGGAASDYSALAAELALKLELRNGAPA